MILFFLCLNGKAEYYNKILEEFRTFDSIFPNFANGEKFTFKSNDLRNFALLQLPSKELSGNRNYLTEDKKNILFYNGLPIDPSGRIQAHKSEVLLKYFDEIKYKYEGQASLIRINKTTYDVDIITDNLGMEQIYYFNKNGELLISNSIQIIENVAGSNELDIAGASTFLSFGWVADNSTLRKEIKVIRGGQHWKWDASKKQLDKKTYFDLVEFNPSSKIDLNNKTIQKLYEELAEYPSILENYFDLECPLTGGFDSRLVAAILISKNIKANYFTTGNPEHVDTKIASLIAEKFNLPYKIYEICYESLLENWDLIINKFIQQTNGLASIWGINGLLTHYDQINTAAGKLSVRLATEGAEATRSTYNHPVLWQKHVSRNDVYKFLTNRCLHNHYDILSGASIDIFHQFLDSFFKINTEKGLEFKLLPGLLYIDELVRRFHGNNRGIYKNVSDSFSMFCTKNYLTTGLKLLPVERATYPVHSKMMKMLNKDLFRLPNEHGNWPVKYPRLKVFLGKTYPVLKRHLSGLKSGSKIKAASNEMKTIPNIKQNFDRKRIFEAKLSEIRSICFDQPNSELWQLIKKENLEKVLSGKNRIEDKAFRQLFVVATLFYYELLSKRKNISKTINRSTSIN